MPYDQDADDAQFEQSAAYDYKVEAFGAPCPIHKTLTWGGDCPDCEIDWDEEPEETR